MKEARTVIEGIPSSKPPALHALNDKGSISKGCLMLKRLQTTALDTGKQGSPLDVLV